MFALCRWSITPNHLCWDMGSLATAAYAVTFCCSIVSWLILLIGTGKGLHDYIMATISRTCTESGCNSIPHHCRKVKDSIWWKQLDKAPPPSTSIICASFCALSWVG